jgi:hypothetical protein
MRCAECSKLIYDNKYDVEYEKEIGGYVHPACAQLTEDEYEGEEESIDTFFADGHA